MATLIQTLTLKTSKLGAWAANVTLALGVVVAIAAPVTPAIAAETDSKVERIEQLLELTNSGDLDIQMMEIMIDGFRQSMPEVPDEWWDRFMEKVTVEEMDALLVPIYERNFTDAEIDAMIAFYETPEGQSMIAKMPTVMQESMLSGQMWGQGIAEELLRELEADGYDLQTSLPGNAASALAAAL